jgi:hypothetical protein
MNKLLTFLFATICFGAVGSHTAAQSLDKVLVEVRPLTAQVALGDTIDLDVTVTNTSGAARNDLIAHIDVTSPNRDGSVDPEDWTATLSKQIDRLEPGAGTTVTWSIQPISPGTFLVYAVVLAPDAPDVAGSNVLTVSVEDQRSLNPQGVLPVVIIVPAAVGALFVSRLRRNRL